jgi:hypothetical protein
VFGKKLSQYLAFQKLVLLLLAAVGLARLGLSLAGQPNGRVAWLSMNVVAWAGALYYGVAVQTRGFGSYRQILPLVTIQTLVQQAIAVLGILLAISGFPNVFAAPEFSFGARSQWLHALSHVAPQGRDELVAALGERLDEAGRLRVVAEYPPDLEDVPPEHFGLHVGVGPDGAEQLLVAHQPPGVLDEVGEHRERLRHQRDPHVAAPQALIDEVQPKRRKRRHVAVAPEGKSSL